MGFENLVDSVAESNLALHAKFRDEFPVTRELIYLNHAAVAPLSRRAANAMKGLLEDASTFGSLHYDRWLQAYEGLRTAAAKLINASPGEIAIVKNTSEGIATIAMGFNWRAGDRIVCFIEEFPANDYPWRRLESRGVAITWLSIYDPLEKIAQAARGARLLAISFVNYLSGFRVDLESVGRLCHENHCFFFVDAIQGMGALHIDVENCHIDGLAADGHKWMLGPEGNGVLYVRKDWLDVIQPTEFGWTNPANFADHSSRDMTLRPTAARYECGTLNTVGCFGQKAAIEFLLEIGVENIAPAVIELADRLDRGIRAKGYEVMIERSPHTASGIMSFRHPSVDSRTLVSQLKRERIIAAPRQGWVRMSPHFYISPDEIDQVIETLPAA